MRKNMPPEALTGPFAQQQKIMLYLFPLIFAVGGINFPVGVLIYWFTSNLWTMGQQFYVIRRNPAPGTPAYDAWEERRRPTTSLKAITERADERRRSQLAGDSQQGHPAAAAQADALTAQPLALPPGLVPASQPRTNSTMRSVSAQVLSRRRRRRSCRPDRGASKGRCRERRRGTRYARDVTPPTRRQT